MTEAITNFDDIIDSWDVIERIEDLEGELETAQVEQDEVRKAGLQDLFIEQADGINASADSDDGNPPATPDETFRSVLSDPCHPLYEEAVELMGLIDGRSLDVFVEEAAGDPRHLMYDEATEYKALKELEEQAEGYSDWQYGAQLIRESYFKDYAQQLAEDIGAVNADATWPNNCIDWDQAARELEVDYTQVDFDGVTYLIRS